jgi:soluble lytic murein transglycosylase-like protein
MGIMEDLFGSNSNPLYSMYEIKKSNEIPKEYEQPSISNMDSIQYEYVDEMDKNPNNKYDHIIDRYSAKYNVSPRLVKAMMRQESGFNKNATSSKGAGGLMQLMPDTAKWLGVKNIYDPEQNIEGGVKYISQLLNKYDQDTELALAAYNAGPGNVHKYNGIPPFKETMNYVNKIMGNYNG